MRSTQIKDISRASTARHITVRATVWKPTACKRRHFALRKTAFGAPIDGLWQNIAQRPANTELINMQR